MDALRVGCSLVPLLALAACAAPTGERADTEKGISFDGVDALFASDGKELVIPPSSAEHGPGEKRAFVPLERGRIWLTYEGEAEIEIQAFDRYPPRPTTWTARGVQPSLEVEDVDDMLLLNYSAHRVVATVHIERYPTEPKGHLAFGAPCQNLPSGNDCESSVCLTRGPDEWGFCSKWCNPHYPDACDQGNDYPGEPECRERADDGFLYCTIFCGPEIGRDDACPDGLTCRDTDENGQNDTCMPKAQLSG